MREWKLDPCPYLMQKELHLFPVLTVELKMLCHDRAYALITDVGKRLKLVCSHHLG